MKRLRENLRSICMLGLLLSVILTFSQCKKDDSELSNDLPDSGSDMEIADTQSVVSSTTPVTINLAKVRQEVGFAYIVVQNFGTTSDSGPQPNISKLRVFENGKELGAAHSSHVSIRTQGKGKFSHWKDGLRFSASDNTDPRKNGRKYTFTRGGNPGSLPTDTIPPVTPPVTPPIGVVGNLIGWGAEGTGVTGGQGGQTVTVSTLAALKSAAGSNSPMIIQVSGTITGTGMVDVRSNKTIVGLKGAKLSGVGLMLYTVNNVIIRNMIIESVVGADCITIKESTHHVWVDHNELRQDRSKGRDVYDGLIDITQKADFVTVSWNKIHDSYIAILVGAGDEPEFAGDKGHLRITFHHNHIYNVAERTPNAKYGYIHMFNNYFDNASYTGASMGATLRLENNYWKNSSLPVRTDMYTAPGFISGLSTNIFDNCGNNRITSAASTWEPSYAYKTSLIPASEVPAKVSAGAGAIL